MAQQYDNTNTGLLAKNDRKERDTHPDYRGKINVEGREFWLSAWIKVGREGSKLAGQKYMSLSVQPIEEQRSRPARSSQPARPQRQEQYQDDVDQDIPF